MLAEHTKGIILYSRKVIINSHKSTSQRHAVTCAIPVTVIIVVLSGLHTEIMLSCAQHWVTKGISLCFLVVEWHCDGSITRCCRFHIRNVTHVRQFRASFNIQFCDGD